MSEMQTEDRPRIALLGEFSAGKSTLVNVLMRGAHSPVRVTATQLPPIWYSYGSGPSVMVDRDGNETELPGGDLTAAPLGETRAIRVHVEADILKRCDLIDMPGSSDPNMTPDIWDALLPQAHAAIWCTPSTQAWRQSEAAIWEEVPEELHERSILLLTRFDKIRMSDDRKRLLARVRKETRDLFRAVHPVALLHALEAKGDPKRMAESGMGNVMAALNETIAEIGGAPRSPLAEVVALNAAKIAEGGDAAAPAAAPSAIMPRRVSRAGTRPTRSRRITGEGSLI